MLSYIARRILVMIPTLLAISFISSAIIQPPSGDYLTTMVNELRSRGASLDTNQLQFMRQNHWPCR